jgi:hypothetical protein
MGMTAQVDGARAIDPAEQRRVIRELVNFDTSVSARGKMVDLRVLNVSQLGLMGRMDTRVAKGDRIVIELPQVKSIEAIVRWVEDGRIGTEFVRPISATDYRLMLIFIPKRQSAW